MLTANTVLPFFYFASLLCLVLGVVLIVTVKSTQELKVSVPQLSIGKKKAFLRKPGGNTRVAKCLRDCSGGQ